MEAMPVSKAQHTTKISSCIPYAQRTVGNLHFEIPQSLNES